MAEIKLYKYEYGDVLECINVSPENFEDLTIGDFYRVVGTSVHDENIIYAVTDNSGTIHYSMDRFKKVDKGKKPMKFKVGDEVYINPESITEQNYEGGCAKLFSVVNDSHIVETAENIIQNWYSLEDLPDFCFTDEDLILASEVRKPIETPKEKDAINPSHYKDHKYETIDVIEDWCKNLVGVQASDTANIIKYISRYAEKDGLQDLKKIHWYVTHLIKNVEANGIIRKDSK